MVPKTIDLTDLRETNGKLTVSFLFGVSETNYFTLSIVALSDFYALNNYRPQSFTLFWLIASLEDKLGLIRDLLERGRSYRADHLRGQISTQIINVIHS